MSEPIFDLTDLVAKARQVGAKAVPETAPATSRDFHTSHTIVEALKKAGFTMSEMAQFQKASQMALASMRHQHHKGKQ